MRTPRPSPVPLKAGEKFCFTCYAAHPVTDFHKDVSRADGLQDMCRRCNSTACARRAKARRARARAARQMAVAA